MDNDLEKAEREKSGMAVDPGTIGRLSGITTSAQSGGEWFGPGKPLAPVAPEDVTGRMFDYPTAYNVNLRPRSGEGVTFEQLRGFADAYDLLRLVIETRKDQVASYSWEVKPKEGKKVSEAAIQEVHDFLDYPDKEHPWDTWIRMLLEDLFVLDASVIYPRETKGGKLYGFELVDPATIKRVLDPSGRTPLPPETAYQQVLKGLPAIDYSTEELIYWMRNPRTNRVYGFSPVEQVMMTVNIALRRQIHQLQYYTEGNIPEAICGVPDSWNLKTLQEFQVWWDSIIEGNTAARRHMRFVPFDPSKLKEVKENPMKDMFDEWLARIICFAFSISPTMLVKETNRATADTIAETALKEGLVPLLNWLRTFFNYLIQVRLGLRDLEFSWEVQKALDPKQQADVDKIYLDAKVITPDEIREERLGKPPLTQQQKDELSPPPPPGLGQPGMPGQKSGEQEPKKPQQPPKSSDSEPQEAD